MKITDLKVFVVDQFVYVKIDDRRRDIRRWRSLVERQILRLSLGRWNIISSRF